MKRFNIISVLLVALALTSCNGWLKEQEPATTTVENYFNSGLSCQYATTGAYVPLMWEYQSTYFSEWFIGDIVSDDALKGGQNVADMGAVYDLENFKTNTNNQVLLEYYRAQYQGIGRCNMALKYIPGVACDADMDQAKKDRFIGELKFLRALYYFRLVRIFGGVPLTTEILEGEASWKKDRATVDQIYNQIIADLTDAESKLWEKSKYPAAELGRATKGAAQAMLLKVNLYRAGDGYIGTEKGSYAEARKWGDKIIQSKQYSLCTNWWDNFSLEGENGPESVFEIQYSSDGTGDYGPSSEGGEGYTRGTFTLVLTRSRNPERGAGWGFNKPSQNLFNEFEDGDARRDQTIFKPEKLQNDEIYLDNPYVSLKYAMMSEFPETTDLHDSRGPLNNKVIRYADVLLMYAEACAKAGAGTSGSAEWALNEIRTRANMATYPNYNIKINGAEITPTLEEAIRHERRVELAMEGHRWFDICRWGKAYEIMTAYKAQESAAAKAEMADFQKGKHELFPIPSQEMQLSGISQQNPGY